MGTWGSSSPRGLQRHDQAVPAHFDFFRPDGEQRGKHADFDLKPRRLPGRDRMEAGIVEGRGHGGLSDGAISGYMGTT